MSERKVREAVNFIRDFFVKRNISVNKLILFGSYARRNFSQDSDVDIAIVSENFTGKDIFQRAEMLEGLQWALVERFMMPFDIVPISLEEWEKSSSLIVGFVKEGQEIFN